MGQTNENRNQNIDSNTKCPYCDKLFSDTQSERPDQFPRHVRLCKVYSKFIVEISNGYQCSLCSNATSKDR